MSVRTILLRFIGDNSDYKAKAAEVDRTNAGLADSAKAVGDRFTGWGKALMPASLAVGAIGIGIIGLANRGSDVSDVADQFSALSRRAKETSQTMLGELRTGTRGTVTDLELMKASNLAVGNGLTVNAQQMGVLAAGAKQLAGGIKGDTVEAFETLTGAINKGHTASLRRLGLFVDEDAALAAHAASIGKTVNAMTDQERSAAIQVGVLAALAAQTALTGDAQAKVGDITAAAGVRFTNMIDRISVMAANSKGLADVLDIVSSGMGIVADVVEAVAGWFAKVPAPVQAVVVVLGGLLAAAGPVLFVVGQLITAWGVIVPLFAAGTTGAGLLAGAIALITGPVGLVVAAVVGLIAIWTTWGDDITRIVTSAYNTIKSWLWDKLEPVLTPIIGLVQSIMEMFEAFGMLVGAVAGKVFGFIYDKIAAAFTFLWDTVTTVVRGIGTLLGKIPDWLLPILGPVGLVIAAFRHWDEVKAIVTALYTAVKTYLLDKFTAIVDGIKGKIDAVTGFFKDMYTKVVGNSYVPDMIEGIAAEFGRLPQVMVAPAQAAASQVQGVFSGLASAIANLPSTILGAIQGGGSVGGSIFSSLGAGLFGAGSGINTFLNNGLSNLATKIGGGFVANLAGTLSSLIPGIGTLLGPLLGNVANKVVGFVGGIFGGGNDTKKDREKLAGLLGFSSLGGLTDALQGMGELGVELARQSISVIGKKDQGANAAWLQSVQELFATYTAESAAATQATVDHADEMKAGVINVGESMTGTIRRLFRNPFELDTEMDKNEPISVAAGIKRSIEDLFRDPFKLTFEYDTPGVPGGGGFTGASALADRSGGGTSDGRTSAHGNQQITVQIGETKFMDFIVKGYPKRARVLGLIR